MTIRWIPDGETPQTYARLSGDFNPVHMDPEHARGAGFADVIVHGMCVLGVASRAAHALAGEGQVLRELSVRFANPVLPGQQLSFDGQFKARGDSTKVSLKALLGDGDKVMSPANFVFAPAGGDWPVSSKLDPSPAEQDVRGDPFRFTAQDLQDYNALTEPTALAPDETVPPMVGLLGMTGALEKAFRDVQPEKPGTWVHLRQSAVFHQAIAPDVDYRCRIQGGDTRVRTADVGAQVTIPLVVETLDGALVSTGTCGLFYAFDKEDS